MSAQAGAGRYDVQIVGHATVERHTEYLLSIIAPSGDTWTLQRRYRVLRDLHFSLQPAFRGRLPAFPERRLFGVGKFLLGYNQDHDEAFVAERQADLQRYLDGLLLLDPQLSTPVLRGFFRCPRPGNPPQEQPVLQNAVASAGSGPSLPAHHMGASGGGDAQRVHWLLGDRGAGGGGGAPRVHWLLGGRAGSAERGSERSGGGAAEPAAAAAGESAQDHAFLELPGVAAALAAAAGATATRQLLATSSATAQSLREVAVALSACPDFIVVLGGSGAGNETVSRLNVKAWRWEPLPPPRTARRAGALASAHGRCIIVGGAGSSTSEDRCHIVGGADSSALECATQFPNSDVAEWLDPMAGESWEPVAAAACGVAFPCAAAAASGGRIYIFGGLSNGRAVSQARRLEVAQRAAGADAGARWELLRPMPTARFECAAAACRRKLYVFGGATSAGEPLAAAECLEPDAAGGGRWHKLPPMSRERFGCSAATAVNKLYVLGGNTLGWCQGVVECFDPASALWASAAPMPVPRMRTGVAGAGAKIYVFGGSGPGEVATGVGESSQDVSSVDCFDTVAGSWEALPPMPEPCARCVAVAVPS